MVLVDTSVWVAHLQRGDEQLASLLNQRNVLCHPFVIGELALGGLPGTASQKRATADVASQVLQDLQALPQAHTANDDEVLQLILAHRLQGAGIGYVDAHLLAATKLSDSAKLWTFDKRLASVAASLGICAVFLQ